MGCMPICTTKVSKETIKSTEISNNQVHYRLKKIKTRRHKSLNLLRFSSTLDIIPEALSHHEVSNSSVKID